MAAGPARAPDAVAPPPGNPRFPLVDSLRALGFLMVFTVHACGQAGIFKDPAGVPWYGAYVTRLEVALPMFFAISAFLLYRPFVAGLVGAARPPRIKSYARARALRIIPAFWVAMTLAAIYPGITGGWHDHWWGYYLFLQEYVPSWNVGSFQHTWHLSVEITFYILLPFLVLAGARLAGRRSGTDRSSILRGQLKVVLALYALSLLARIVLTASGYEAAVNTVTVSPRNAYSILLPGTLYTALPATFDWIALGMGLALTSVWLDGRRGHPRWVGVVRDHPAWPWALAAAIWLSLVWLGPHYPEPYRTASFFTSEALYGLIAVLLLAPAVFGHTAGGAVRKFLATRPLAWLGLVSYGFFLWHLPILVKIGDTHAFDFPGVPRTVEVWVMGFLLTLPCAAASYYLLERPLLRLKYRRRENARPASLDAQVAE
jgi:peptidoglycan/LPS O-acetylase OafA/YrhL